MAEEEAVALDAADSPFFRGMETDPKLVRDSEESLR